MVIISNGGGTIAYNSDRTPVGGGSAISFYFMSPCPYYKSGSTNTTKWTKYTIINSSSSTGTADNKTILEPDDNAAHVLIGGSARMPTKEEFDELINACDITWMTNYNSTGINGTLFTLKTDSSKKLFFPAAGLFVQSSWNIVDSGGNYWSSSIYNHSYYGGYLRLDSSNCYINNYYRCYGLSIRAVKPK